MSEQPGLSAAALIVRDALEDFARRHPEAGKPALAWYLALRYCPRYLRRQFRLRRMP